MKSTDPLDPCPERPKRRYHLNLPVEGDSVADILRALVAAAREVTDSFRNGLTHSARQEDCNALAQATETPYYDIHQAVIFDEGPARTHAEHKRLIAEYDTAFRAWARRELDRRKGRRKLDA